MYGPKTAKGPGRYIKEVLDRLIQIDAENDFVVFLSRENFAEFQPQNPRVKKVLAPWRWYTLAEQLYFSRLIKKERVDFMWFPHFNVPIPYFGRYVVTIHDVLLRYHHSKRATTLGPLKFFIKKILYRLTIYSAAKKAERIIAISEFTRDEIIKFYPFTKDKVVVTLEGIVERAKSEEKVDDESALLRYNIAKPYIVYVGNSYPHKNLETLIKAFEILKQKWDGNLVLCGGRDYFYERLKNEFGDNEANTKSVQSGKIIFSGFIEDADLPAIYRNATLYVFPSLYEGFGLPPLEAMGEGVPVICSDIPCLREICAAAAEYFNPRDEKDMAEKILALLVNPARRAGLRRAGFEQIKKYSWDKCAKETKKIFNY